MDGRGAYVCGDAGHWGNNCREADIDRGRLRHALKTKIDDSTVKLLSQAFRAHAAELSIHRKNILTREQTGKETN
jgi:predicted RNA-binding protein YlxR (DUF448 family)